MDVTGGNKIASQDPSPRSWWILAGSSAALFLVWLGIGGYRWEGYPCFVWKAGSVVRMGYFVLLLAVICYYCRLLLDVVIEPQRLTNRALVLALASFVLLRVILGSALPLLGDEAYHWLWPAHLDWCYYDHGGLLGWICYPARWLSKSVVAARSIPILLGTLTAMLTWRFAFWLTGDEGLARRVLAGLCILPMGLLATTILFTDTPLAILWIGGAWATLAALKRRTLRNWLLVGLILGLGFNCKFLIFGLIFMLLVYVLLDRSAWGAFRTPGPYLAGLIAVLMAFPLIYWNARHGWQTFYFNFITRRSALGFFPAGLATFALQQAVLVGPLLFVWCLVYPAGWTWRQWRDRRPEALSLALTGYIPFVLYGGLKLFRPTFTSAMNWTPPLLLLILILLAWSARESNSARRGLIAALRVGAVTSIVLIAILIGQFFLGPSTLTAGFEYLKTFPPLKRSLSTAAAQNRWNRYQVVFFGPYPMGKELDLLYERYNAVAPTFILARHYMVASELSQYTGRPPLVLSMGNDNMYGRCFDYWNEPAKHVGHDALYVAGTSNSERITQALAQVFESVRELNPSQRVSSNPICRSFRVYHCRKARTVPGAAAAYYAETK